MRTQPLRVLLIPAFLAQWLAACGSGTEPGQREQGNLPEPAQESPQEQAGSAEPTIEEQLEHLAAMGYAGYSDEDPEGDSGVEVLDPERFTPGYLLVACLSAGAVDLIDKRDGALVNTWSFEGSQSVGRARLLPDGDVLVISLHPEPKGSEPTWNLLRVAWSGDVRWSLPIGAHHDVWLLPDDRAAVLTFEHRTDVDLREGRPLRDEHVTLVSLDGEVLEQHSFWELVSADEGVLRRMNRRFFRRGGVRSEPFWDFFHANSVDWFTEGQVTRAVEEARPELYRAGNFLVSFRMQDTVAIFDPRSDEVLWTWGLGELQGPHEARLLENGNVLLFDNGCWSRDHSRLVEVDPRTDEIVWTYTAPEPTDFFCKTRGGVQPLAAGHKLVVASNQGRAFEIDAEGRELWRYRTNRTNEAGRSTTVRLEQVNPEVVEAILKSR